MGPGGGPVRHGHRVSCELGVLLKARAVGTWEGTPPESNVGAVGRGPGSRWRSSPTFGEQHDFALVRVSEGQTTLAFCGKAAGPTIHGLITLVPGDSMISAEWRFETPDPEEEAGGSVSFASYHDAAGQRHLVANRGLFFRRSGSGTREDASTRFVRLVSSEMRWYLHPVNDHPCTGGLSIYRGPARTPEAKQFHDCVASHWGRR